MQVSMPPYQYYDIAYGKTLHRVLNKTLKFSDFKIAWKRGYTLFNTLRNGKDKIPVNRKPGVYAIPVFNKDEDSEQLYIGSTKRNLSA